MDAKTLLWNFGRLALAVLLLSLDQRLFLFYLFTIALTGLHQLDRLRAIVRVYQVANEAHMFAIEEKLGVTIADVERTAVKIGEMTTRSNPESWSAFRKDEERAYGGKTYIGK